ncbi:Dabb family protein [Agromyces sp. H3Y2-19a]|jgi:hypothetical protein|uniref:Dabb family protein n=1 Tax=Agromyces TaxID=33877 RepID=UPI001E294814|nr:MULTISPECIES: Dabb family protein [Agromyces]MCD5348281.1 Dabb family protein [Agromyces sp. S2-1-8]MDF0514114.1 Dabb family protein [Agromyces chromiiresistens]
MPIEHTVVFRLVHEAGSDEESAFLRAGRDTLTAIPGVTGFAVMRQVSPGSPFTHQFRMVFADAAAYDAYNRHPAHVGFVEERWVPEVADFQEFDFEPA